MTAGAGSGEDVALRVPGEVWRRQIADILQSWGMPPDHVEIVSDVLLTADLMGIDSHGATLLPLYEQQIGNGGATPAAEVAVVHDRAAVALLDGGAGFGHVPTMMAVEMAAERAQTFGISAVAIRNSNHYGAAGVYARRLAERGLIGFSTSSVWRAAIVPTAGREPQLGTNPIAFAAPSARGRPFLLDMATSTAAIGKLKLAARAGREMPEGWALTRDGAPERDPERALLDVLLVPLGGHKGYGLATMVEVLSSTLSGAAQTPLRGEPGRQHDVGHFVMAMDPALIRGSREAFEDDLDRMLDALRETPAADPDLAVMVAGDPEYRKEDERRANGIPVSPVFAEQLRQLSERAGVPFILEETPR